MICHCGVSVPIHFCCIILCALYFVFYFVQLQSEQVSLGKLTKTMRTSTTFTLTRTLLLNTMVTGYVLRVTLKGLAEAIVG